VQRVVGRGVPIDRENVDTDQIIPAHWLKRIERTGYGAGLFEAWRRDPAFALNDPRYAGASVLVAGANFGSGSSREHAAWALEEAGFRAVIAPKLADIFRSNLLKNGLVPVELSQALTAKLMAGIARDPGIEIAVDVASARVDVPALGISESFALDAHTRTRLTQGLDEIALTLRAAPDIGRFEAARPAWLPSATRRASVSKDPARSVR
jgi:3-isopropylmalate/(R)-2-methylmalate dehydratase small subunit